VRACKCRYAAGDGGTLTLTAQTIKSQQAMGKAMYSVTLSLQAMNRQMNMPAMQKMMMEFEKQSELMEFKQEMMDDVMDDALAADDEEEKTEEMVDQILDEAGIAVGASLASAPIATGSVRQVEEDTGGDRDLQARLDSLRALK